MLQEKNWIKLRHQSGDFFYYFQCNETMKVLKDPNFWDGKDFPGG
jgi:hypothetical protein